MPQAFTIKETVKQQQMFNWQNADIFPCFNNGMNCNMPQFSNQNFLMQQQLPEMNDQELQQTARMMNQENMFTKFPDYGFDFTAAEHVDHTHHAHCQDYYEASHNAFLGLDMDPVYQPQIANAMPSSPPAPVHQHKHKVVRQAKLRGSVSSCHSHDSGVSALTSPETEVLEDRECICRWQASVGGLTSMCGAVFANPASLQSHLVKEHLGTIEGPAGHGYYCRWDGCHRPNEPFSQKSKLQGHFLTHSNRECLRFDDASNFTNIS